MVRASPSLSKDSICGTVSRTDPRHSAEQKAAISASKRVITPTFTAAVDCSGDLIHKIMLHLDLLCCDVATLARLSAQVLYIYYCSCQCVILQPHNGCSWLELVLFCRRLKIKKALALAAAEAAPPAAKEDAMEGAEEKVSQSLLITTLLSETVPMSVGSFKPPYAAAHLHDASAKYLVFD